MNVCALPFSTSTVLLWWIVVFDVLNNELDHGLAMESGFLPLYTDSSYRFRLWVVLANDIHEISYLLLFP